MAPTPVVSKVKSSAAKPKAGAGPNKKKLKTRKPRYIQRKNAKPAFKKKTEDLSESDFDSDEDFGLNGPEYGLLSDTDTSGELEEGIPELPVYPGLAADVGDDESEDNSNSEDDELEEKEGESEEEEDNDEDGSSSGEEVPEPEGSVEGDSSDEEEKNKAKLPKRDLEREARTVFVGNLPCSVKKMKLKKWFSKFGEVESVRLRCPPIANPDVPKKVSAMQKDFHEERTNISAFVRFKDAASIDKAISANGAQWDETHNIRVDRSTGGKEHDDKKAVFVGNLPFDAEENQIRAVFLDCGDIVNVRIVRDRRTNVGKGFAYVNFTERHSVPLALSKNGEKIGKRAIRVEKCNYKGPSNPNDSKKVSQNFIDKRKSFMEKKFKNNPKKPKKSGPGKSQDGDEQAAFQGWQAKKREKRMKKKKNQKVSKKEQFIEILNSKSKKHKTS
uniref:RNA-binding protein 34 n=1 Tax=Lygus hesperus TaxID=30085 RepID=A0A146KSP7_LYGHE